MSAVMSSECRVVFMGCPIILPPQAAECEIVSGTRCYTTSDLVDFSMHVKSCCPFAVLLLSFCCPQHRAKVCTGAAKHWSGLLRPLAPAAPGADRLAIGNA